ncbi:hypothetical protein HK097_003376, partial [Rhizophlyctis rosea]
MAIGVGAALDPVMIRGTGASFPSTVYQDWAATFNATYCNRAGSAIIGVDYETTSSSNALQVIQHPDTNYSFVGSDIMPDASLMQSLDLVVIPVLQGSIVITYNIPRLTTPLTLTRQNLVDIFDGRITHWNDPTLLTLNPDLPAAFPIRGDVPPILLVLRSYGSGTSINLMHALHSFDPTFPAPVPPRDSILKVTQSTSVLKAASKQAVEILLGSVAWSIGSMSGEDFGKKTGDGLGVARIINRNGDVVDPTIESVQANQLGDVQESLVDSPHPGAYPVTAVTYYVMRNNTITGNEAVARGTLQYLWWTLNRGDEIAEHHSFVPVRASINELGNALLGKVTEEGRSLANSSLCDFPETACVCDRGWMNVYGIDCHETEDQLIVNFSQPHAILGETFIILALFIILVSTILIYIYQDRPAIKMFPPSCAYTILFGAFLTVMGAQFYLAVATEVVCSLRVFWAPAGAGICFSMLILQMHRVHTVYDSNKVKKTLTNARVIISSIAVGAIQVIYIGILVAITRPGPRTDLHITQTHRSCHPRPEKHTLYLLLEASTLAINAFLMMVCIYYAFLTRNVQRQHNYAKSVTSAILIVGVICLFGIPIAIKEESDPENVGMAVILRVIIYVACAAFLVIALFAPRIVEAIVDQRTHINTTLAEMTTGNKGINLTAEWEGDEKGFTCFVFVVRVSEVSSSLPQSLASQQTNTLLIVPDMDLLVIFESITKGTVKRGYKLSEATYRFPNLAFAPTRTEVERSDAAKVIFKSKAERDKDSAGLGFEFATIERMQAFKTVLEAAAFRLQALKRKEGVKDGKG